MHRIGSTTKREFPYWCGLGHSNRGEYKEVMPKQKTHKGTKKRFRVTANNKVKHRPSGTSHLATRKTHKQKRMLRGTQPVSTVAAKRVLKALHLD